MSGILHSVEAKEIKKIANVFSAGSVSQVITINHLYSISRNFLFIQMYICCDGYSCCNLTASVIN